MKVKCEKLLWGHGVYLLNIKIILQYTKYMVVMIQVLGWILSSSWTELARQ